jgi:uncharacterized protein (DUF433 family)
MMIATKEVMPVPVYVNEHGSIRFKNSRITLDSVVYAYREGATAEEIIEMYDTLQLADVHAAIAYYLNNREMIDEYLRQGEEDFERKRLEAQATPEYQAFLKKLMSRYQLLKNEDKWRTSTMEGTI